MAKKPSAIDSPPDFESALAELESIVQELERGSVSLETSLERFARGVALLQRCRGLLDSAELKVRELVAIDEDGTPRLKNFRHEATIDELPDDAPPF